MISADELRERAAGLGVPEDQVRRDHLISHVLHAMSAFDRQVPTPAAFVAMKLIAWEDRHAPRDLFDLRELALRAYFTPEVAPLVRAITGYTPSGATLGTRVPLGVERAWGAELGHQLSALPDPRTCLEMVRLALEGELPSE
jgi:Nucleotidyl transferase AbiEii toxin, Type IV TA system